MAPISTGPRRSNIIPPITIGDRYSSSGGWRAWLSVFFSGKTTASSSRILPLPFQSCFPPQLLFLESRPQLDPRRGPRPTRHAKASFWGGNNSLSCKVGAQWKSPHLPSVSWIPVLWGRRSRPPHFRLEVMPAGLVRAQRGSWGTSREGPWLRAISKSNSSQQEVKGFIIEALERARYRASGRLRRGESPSLCLGAGVFTEDSGLVSGPPRHPGTLGQGRGARCQSWEPGVSAWSCVAPVVWNAHLMASAGPSLDVTYSKEIINSCPLQRRQTLFAPRGMGKVGVHVLARTEAGKGTRSRFYGVLQVPRHRRRKQAWEVEWPQSHADRRPGRDWSPCDGTPTGA